MLQFGNIDILIDKQAEILPYMQRVRHSFLIQFKQILWSCGIFGGLTLGAMSIDEKINWSILLSISILIMITLGMLNIVTFVLLLKFNRFAIALLKIKNNSFSIVYKYKDEELSFNALNMNELKVELKKSYERGNHHQYLVLSHPAFGKIRQNPCPPWTEEVIIDSYNQIHQALYYIGLGK